MYTKEQASAVRQKFWVSFGRYIAPIPSASNEKVKWINYRTGIPNIQFKMDVNKEQAWIAVEISGKPEDRKRFFEQFKTFKNALEDDYLEEKWIWEESAKGD